MDIIKFIICHGNSDAFIQGRKIAKKEYYKYWGTQRMSDDYDVGIIAYSGDTPIANINIQFGTKKNKLFSEHYYGHQHWLEYCNIDRIRTGELCGLSIDDTVSNKTKPLLLAGLIVMSHLTARSKGIVLFATIQRPALLRKLANSMGYPFQAAQSCTINKNNIPQDRYWINDTPPKLYFIDLINTNTINASFDLLSYLHQYPVIIENKLYEQNKEKGLFDIV